MTADEIKDYCRSKKMITEENPFGDISICFKLKGKIFAQLYPYEYDYKITLKCTVDAGQFFRMAYPEKVVRGYHWPPVQQPYWNTIFLDDFPDDVLKDMIDLAYDTVFLKLSKKMQEEIKSNL